MISRLQRTAEERRQREKDLNFDKSVQIEVEFDRGRLRRRQSSPLEFPADGGSLHSFSQALSLGFILSEKEDGLQVEEQDIAVGVKKCGLSLIGKIFGDKKTNSSGLKVTLGNIWVTSKPFSIRNLAQSMFQFIFQLAEDRDKILLGKTWSFDDQYILLKEWTPDPPLFVEEDKRIKGVGVEDTPPRSGSSPIGQEIGVNCIGGSGSSKIGKEPENFVATTPHPIPVTHPPDLVSDDNLVDVTIQPVSIGQRVAITEGNS
ncbi:Unknown protein [Striga hermonthica]|uniref:DUF4283 domain-containing protein n=1 Tax=Striga hermonthica TaxID=68872 RepID=A0A9N7R5C5_STRHE|nr:Unknown protein [Striga hermonthica]